MISRPDSLVRTVRPLATERDGTPGHARARRPGVALISLAATLLTFILGAMAGAPTRRARVEPFPFGEPRLFRDSKAALSARTRTDKLSAEEFAKLVRDFSEDGGYFFSDNLTSNETAYLHVVSRMRQLAGSGGAYIGVGPEQNFTYIAKLRPRIAFIIDIRRQAMIQHLMFKALFHLAPTRLQYLSMLLSRSVTDREKTRVPGPDASITEILDSIGRAPADAQYYDKNLAAIRKTLRDDFQIQLSESDQASLDYIYRSFKTDGLDAAFKMDSFPTGWFPTLKELILQPDQFGKLGNFLAGKDDYDYVRDLQERNLVIPIVGDFAGRKALPSIADYLRKKNYTVSAFYTSNVEQYLFQDGLFSRFVENVRKLPIGERSLFIRAVLNQRFDHPARVGSHMLTTILQRMNVFIADYDAGLYRGYTELVTTHYIAGESSQR